MKVAIVVGHNESKKGFNSKRLGYTEYDYMSEVAEYISSPLLKTKVFKRKPSTSYSEEIKKVYNALDDWGADISIELHFNAFDGKSNNVGTGTETLSSGSEKSLILSNIIQDAMVEEYGLVNRGVKVRNKRERGGKSLHYGKAVATLIEPFFGDEQEDVNAAIRVGKEGLAKIIVEAALDYKKAINEL